VCALLQTRTDYEAWQGASRLRAAEYLLYADGVFAATGGHRTTRSGAVTQSLRVTAGADHGEESARSGMMRTAVHGLTQ